MAYFLCNSIPRDDLVRFATWRCGKYIADKFSLFCLNFISKIQTVKESMSIKALWLWIGANVIIVITFVVALSSSTYPFTMWTLHNW